MILMYHHVCPTAAIPSRHVPLEGWNFNIEPQAFSNQLQAIAERGFTFVSLSEYSANLSLGSRYTSRHVAITFDDGWIDNYEHALPVLKQLNLTATFFIVSGPMQDVGQERRIADSRLREMLEQGMTIGAHSVSHNRLGDLSGTALKHEVRGSKADLEDRLGIAVKFFAYPGGNFRQSTVDACKEAGFEAACSVISWGLNSEQSRFWLYRDVFTEQFSSWSDRLRINRTYRKLFQGRASQALRRSL